MFLRVIRVIRPFRVFATSALMHFREPAAQNSLHNYRTEER